MKPQPKRELAIEEAMEPVYTIKFYASKDSIEDVKEFGEVLLIPGNNHYLMRVDKRYDFQEVLKYMEDYG